jgi:hypothetical protein
MVDILHKVGIKSSLGTKRTEQRREESRNASKRIEASARGPAVGWLIAARNRLTLFPNLDRPGCIDRNLSPTHNKYLSKEEVNHADVT